MARPLILLSALLCLVCLSALPACGACPSAGDACDEEGAEAADSDLTPLRCRDGRWITGDWSGKDVCCGNACVVA